METLAVGEAERFGAEADLLGDRLRVSVINIATSEGSILTIPAVVSSFRGHFLFLELGLESGKSLHLGVRFVQARRRAWRSRTPSWACIADLSFKTAEQLAKDVELFAQHAGRKSIMMEDVTLTAHRNGHLMGLLRTFSQELKGKEPSTRGRERDHQRRTIRRLKPDFRYASNPPIGQRGRLKEVYKHPNYPLIQAFGDGINRKCNVISGDPLHLQLDCQAFVSKK